MTTSFLISARTIAILSSIVSSIYKQAAIWYWLRLRMFAVLYADRSSHDMTKAKCSRTSSTAYTRDLPASLILLTLPPFTSFYHPQDHATPGSETRRVNQTNLNCFKTSTGASSTFLARLSTRIHWSTRACLTFKITSQPLILSYFYPPYQVRRDLQWPCLKTIDML